MTLMLLTVQNGQTMPVNSCRPIHTTKRVGEKVIEGHIPAWKPFGSWYHMYRHKVLSWIGTEYLTPRVVSRFPVIVRSTTGKWQLAPVSGLSLDIESTLTKSQIVFICNQIDQVHTEPVHVFTSIYNLDTVAGASVVCYLFTCETPAGCILLAYKCFVDLYHHIVDLW